MLGHLVDGGWPTRESIYDLHDQVQSAADNRDLRARLDVAAAVIQRLSLDNQALQDQLHAARNVTVIAPRR